MRHRDIIAWRSSREITSLLLLKKDTEGEEQKAQSIIRNGCDDDDASRVETSNRNLLPDIFSNLNGKAVNWLTSSVTLMFRLLCMDFGINSLTLLNEPP